MRKTDLINMVRFNRYQAMIFSILALLLSYWFFIRTGLGQTIDTLGMFALHFLNKENSGWEELFLKEYFSYFSAFILAIIILIILYRRIYRLGVMAVLMATAATITTQILKHQILERPSLGITYYISNSFPSGHTTTGTVLAIVFIMACAARWKNAAALLASLIITLVALAVIVARWHRGSDILGGILVVAIMMLAFYYPEKGKTPSQMQLKITFLGLKLGFFGFVVSLLLTGICCIRIHMLKIDKNIGLAFDQIVKLSQLHSNLALLSAGAVVLMAVSTAVMLSFSVVRIGQKEV